VISLHGILIATVDDLPCRVFAWNFHIFMLENMQDDYLFHIYLFSLLSVEEAVTIEELLGYTQDDSMEDSSQDDPRISIIEGPEPIEGGTDIWEDDPSFSRISLL
jgi:hypothetical protein